MARGSATTGQELRRVRRRPRELDSVAGKAKLLAPRGYEPQTGQWISPAREAWGLADYERKTPELRARLTHMVTAVGSYVEAQELAAPWGTPVSDGCIHQQVAKLGQKSQALKLPTEAACANECWRPAPSSCFLSLGLLRWGHDSRAKRKRGRL